MNFTGHIVYSFIKIFRSNNYSHEAEYIASFADRVRELYPSCPIGREKIIAELACRKYSGRVGRSTAAKELDKKAVCLAVAAHVRHQETNYDELLLTGFERWEAREQVHAQVSHVLAEWQSTTSQQGTFRRRPIDRA